MAMKKNIPPFKPHDKTLSSGMLNHLRSYVLRQIIGGKNINVRFFGNRLVVEFTGTAKSKQGGTSDGATTNVNWVLSRGAK